MRVSVAWLRGWVEAPADPAVLEEALVRVGIEVEEVVDLASTVDGPLVVGRVLEIEELTGYKKRIRYCQVDVGEAAPRGIICGAFNFAVGDLVVVAPPGTVLPGGFAIAARRTYDRISDGMICSARELGIGDDHTGIIVLPPDSAAPGDPARPLVGLDDIVLDLEVTPDRGYCLSVRGIARELSHALGVPFRDPALAVDPPGATPTPPYPVSVEDPLGCDRFSARLVRGIDPAAPTPPFMKSRLAVAGLRSISLAVDITNYLMLELGQPMHAFDPNRLSGPLVVRRARPGERLTTLDGVERRLDPEDMVICDDTGPISLAAVMGGESSEMQRDSVDVLFEAAHWDPVMVSRTARRHRLLSEAAKRWERGVDPQLPLVALEKAVRLLTLYAGGELDPRILDLDAVVPPQPVRVGADLPALPERRPASDCLPRSLPERRPASDCLPRRSATCSSSRRRRGGPTCSSRPTSPRRWSGSTGTTRYPACCRSRRPGAGSPRSSAASAASAGRWPRTGTSRCSRTRSPAPRCWTRCRSPRATRGATRYG